MPKIMLTRIQQSTLSPQARMGSDAPPPRIPKLKVKNRPEITPVHNDQTVFNQIRPLGNSSSSIDSPSTPSTPSSGILSPTPQRPNQASQLLTTNDAQPKKKGGLKGFLSTKEPSTVAFLKYAEQQQRATALGASSSSHMQHVSQQKLPDYVPKVNAKWDGMPKSAHQPGHDQWKRSTDHGSLFSKTSKRSTSLNTRRSSNGGWTGYSQSSSGGSGSRGSGGSSGSSGQVSHDRMSTAQADMFSLSRAPSHAQEEPQTRDTDPKPSMTSTHNLTLDGYETNACPSAASAPTQHIDDYFASLSDMPRPRKSSSTETIKALTKPSSSQPLEEAVSSAVVTSTSSPELPKPPSEIHPAFRTKSGPTIDTDLAVLLPQPRELAPHTPDDVFPESPHNQRGSTLSSFDGAQWPLAAPSATLPTAQAKASQTASPPIPVRSPYRQFHLPARSITPVPQYQTHPTSPTQPEPPSPIQPQPTSPVQPQQVFPVSPPQSPTRTGSASPRSFSRPFNTGLPTPPSHESELSTPVQSPRTPTTPAGAVAGPAIRPDAFRGNVMTNGVLLKPPSAAIGRPVTKDSKLTPIIESDAASALSVPVSMCLDAPDEADADDYEDEDEDDDDDDVAAEPPPPIARSRERRATYDTSQNVEPVRILPNTSSLNPYVSVDETEIGPDDTDHQSLADTASVHSNLSVSWYRSPKERLGLGGLIRHDRAGVPWPVGLEEDLSFVPGDGAAEAEGKRRRTWLWKK